MAKKKRRKLTRAQARAEAQRRKRQRKIMWAVAGVVAAAVIVVLALIALGGGGSTELVEAAPLRDDVETGITDEGYPYRGSADAPVTLVEYSDYNCGGCQTYALTVAPVVDDEFVATGQAKYVVQPFALWDFSLPIVEAAACARDQDGFWDFHHWVFTNASLLPQGRSPSRGLLRDLAEASGLDVDAFDACLDERRHRDEVQASTEDAKVRLGINGTPTILVNGVAAPASLQGIRNAVQAAMAGG
jgi:protein-disulfide isomerase